MMLGHVHDDRPREATRRRYGKDAAGRQVYQALHEVMDQAGHVIGVGELFTVAGGRHPMCGDCRRVVLRGA